MAKKRATPRERRAEAARHHHDVREGRAAPSPMSPRTRGARIVAIVLVFAMVASVAVALLSQLLGGNDDPEPTSTVVITLPDQP